MTRSNLDDHIWRGRTANVLALGAAGSLGTLSLGLSYAAIAGNDIPESAVTVLSTGIGALVGAVATYLGGSRRDDKPTTEPAKPTTEPAEPAEPKTGKHRA